MDAMARLGAHLAAALQGGGTDADRLLLLHTLTDLVAILAAGATAAGILWLLYRRRDFDFRFLLLVTAAAFATAAAADGTALWTLAFPDRWLAAWTLLAGAAAGLGAALVFWMQLPDVVRLPSGRQLRRANAALTRENWDLRRGNERLEHDGRLAAEALALASEGIAVLSPEGTWLHANEALARQLGHTREELLKRPAREVFGARLLEARGELAESTGDARLFWHVTPLAGGAGEPRARVIRCRPVAGTDPARQQLESELAEQRRRADEALALLQHGLAEKEKVEAELARRAEQLERNAAQLERIGARITELTGADPVTGLGSSQSLAGRLELAVGLGKRYAQPFAVLLVTADAVDDLKPGDRPLLAALGEVIRAELRETDAAARCDEERICVLLSQTDAAEAARVAERVRARLSATPLAMSDGRTLRLSCRIGAAQWRPGQGLGEVLGEAAGALRADRGRGRSSARG